MFRLPKTLGKKRKDQRGGRRIERAEHARQAPSRRETKLKKKGLSHIAWKDDRHQRGLRMREKARRKGLGGFENCRVPAET